MDNSFKRLVSWRRRVLPAAVTALLALQIGTASAAGPFAPLSGKWLGGGMIDLPSGARERIRCRAIYVVSSSGHAFAQLLRCASDSFIVDIHSDVAEQRGAMAGSWSETTTGTSGNLIGEVRGSAVRATVTGFGFTAALSLVTRGRSQFVSIRLLGATSAGVTAAFHRE